MFKLNYCVLSIFFLFITVQCSYDRVEGERCETEQGVGKCVHVFRCLSSIVDLKAKSHPKICSFKRKEPIICCNDCELVNDTRNAIVDTGGGVYFKSGRKAIDKCLEHLSYLPYPCQTRGLEKIWDDKKQCNYYEVKVYAVVHGGENAERSRYPHMALLGYGQEVDSAQWLCGGSLISDRFILTAAHCIIESAIGPVTFVAMGILKRSDPMKLWQIYKVRRIMQHPEYAPPSKYNDIALIEIDRPVQYSKDVFPACLDYEGQDQFNAQATGWGKLGKHQPLADNLQTVTLQKFSSEQCLKNYPPHRLLKQGYNSETQLCYGDLKEPKDTCEGDSGGPLQVTPRLSKCLYSIIGVTSYGRACGYAGDAGMYTRVYHYVPWIESVVWPGRQ
ncbi:venom protease-like [Spodoptera litura]|uniref:Venom protease-like n=1 Tax=Spodoptera litura TaxID=69820 RepID=A0A9J7DXS0_SPOLT|nr:venom protease-like [Spodoptera litura]